MHASPAVAGPQANRNHSAFVTYHDLSSCNSEVDTAVETGSDLADHVGADRNAGRARLANVQQGRADGHPLRHHRSSRRPCDHHISSILCSDHAPCTCRMTILTQELHAGVLPDAFPAVLLKLTISVVLCCKYISASAP